MSGVKLVRFAAVLIVLAGYAVVFRAGEARIGDRIGENARLADRLRAGERALASRAGLERERAQLRERRRSADLAADRPALIARFLRDAAATAASHHAAITSVVATGGSSAVPAVARAAAPPAADRTPPSPATTERAASPPADEAFDAIALDVTVDGRYADVLATVRALSESRVLASVGIASLARKSAAAADGSVTASLHVSLERILPAPTAVPSLAEPLDARSRPV